MECVPCLKCKSIKIVEQPHTYKVGVTVKLYKCGNPNTPVIKDLLPAKKMENFACPFGAERKEGEIDE